MTLFCCTEVAATTNTDTVDSDGKLGHPSLIRHDGLCGVCGTNLWGGDCLCSGHAYDTYDLYDTNCALPFTCQEPDGGTHAELYRFSPRTIIHTELDAGTVQTSYSNYISTPSGLAGQITVETVLEPVR